MLFKGDAMSDPSTHSAAASSAFARAALTALWQRSGRAWEALRAKVFVWRNTGNRSAATALAWVALAAVVLAVVLLNTCSDAPDLAQRPSAVQPAAVRINPLAELVDRIDTLDDQVAELSDQVAALEDQRQASNRSTPRPAAASHTTASQPAQQQPGAAWLTPTDLDRSLSKFSQSLQEPTK
jgi:outer membrane murein-binding lipoprotein Lpp